MLPNLADTVKAANMDLDQHTAALRTARKALRDAITTATAAAEASGYQGGAADAAALDYPSVLAAQKVYRLAKYSHRLAQTRLELAEASREAFSGYGTTADLRWYERAEYNYNAAKAKHAAFLETL